MSMSGAQEAAQDQYAHEQHGKAKVMPNACRSANVTLSSLPSGLRRREEQASEDDRGPSHKHSALRPEADACTAQVSEGQKKKKKAKVEEPAPEAPPHLAQLLSVLSLRSHGHSTLTVTTSAECVKLCFVALSQLNA
jgi:hypothetical protein